MGYNSDKGKFMTPTLDRYTTDRRVNDKTEEITALRGEVNALREEVEALKVCTSEIVSLRKLYDAHDIILVRGNGKPSMQEDVRNLLGFMKSMNFWITTIAVLFAGQFVAAGTTIVFTIIQVLPYLKAMEK